MSPTSPGVILLLLFLLFLLDPDLSLEPWLGIAQLCRKQSYLQGSARDLSINADPVRPSSLGMPLLNPLSSRDLSRWIEDCKERERDVSGLAERG
jgi:hypothetical protein